MTENHRVVQRIERGIVIDHVPAGKSKYIVRILKLETAPATEYYTGINVSSQRLGRKDFIKIVNRDLTRNELDKIALFAPRATVNRIENFAVKEKIPITAPEKVEGVLVCPNMNCITNYEPGQESRFLRTSQQPLAIRCAYCEREFGEDEFNFL